MGYPPLMGKLHTRYSPVRRSPTRCCHLSLPLDLHVLSLSLAFILSQDQTLRCYKLFLNLFSPRSVFIAPRFDGLFLVLYYWCDICNSLKDLSIVFFRKRGAKIRSFLFILQIFARVFFSSSIFRFRLDSLTSPIVDS